MLVMHEIDHPGKPVFGIFSCIFCIQANCTSYDKWLLCHCLTAFGVSVKAVCLSCHWDDYDTCTYWFVFSFGWCWTFSIGNWGDWNTSLHDILL